MENWTCGCTVSGPPQQHGKKHYAGLFEGVGFKRGWSSGVVFYPTGRDLSVAAHGGDFTFCGMEGDLMWIRDLMESWFEVKVRAILSGDPWDNKEVMISGRVVR